MNRTDLSYSEWSTGALVLLGVALMTNNAVTRRRYPQGWLAP